MSRSLPRADEYDCESCGACCISNYSDTTYVHLRLDDIDRLDPEEQDTLIIHDDVHNMWTAAMKTRHDHLGNCRCIALVGRPGESVTCSIYERRPTACRKFEPGTDECDYARRSAFGISTK